MKVLTCVLIMMALSVKPSFCKISVNSIVPGAKWPDKFFYCLETNATDTIAFNECFVEHNYTAIANCEFVAKMLDCQQRNFLRRHIGIGALVHETLKSYDEQGYIELLTSFYRLGEEYAKFGNCLQDYDDVPLRDVCYLCSTEYEAFTAFYDYWLQQPYDWGYDQNNSNVTMFEKIMDDPVLPEYTQTEKLFHLYMCFITVLAVWRCFCEDDERRAHDAGYVGNGFRPIYIRRRETQQQQRIWRRIRR